MNSNADEPAGLEERASAFLSTINSDDWAIRRVAELRASGQKATFLIEWVIVSGRGHYGVMVRRADGTIERAPRTDCRHQCREQGMAHPSCDVHRSAPRLDLKAEHVGPWKELRLWDGSFTRAALVRIDVDGLRALLATRGLSIVQASDEGDPQRASLDLPEKPAEGVEISHGGASAWEGCGECDPAFPCHEGRARCLRLQPLDPWRSLNDAIDLVVDLGGVIDEGIEGKIFGKMQVAVRHLSLRSRKWLSVQTEARKRREAPATAEAGPVPVIVESPFAGDVEANTTYLRACLRDCLLRGEAPFASHAIYTLPGVLDDLLPDERALGIAAGFAWKDLAAKTVVYTDLGTSPGMQAGIERARARGQEVEVRILGPGWKAERT